MSRYGGRGSSSSTVVYLNVYDLSENNKVLYQVGCGAHHSGVQVGQREYTYAGGSGIYSTEPLNAPGAVFRETLELGKFTGTSAQLDAIIESLRPSFPPSGYNILTKNCNTFAEAFASKLCPGRPFPAHVNRLAAIGQMFSCCLPPEFVDPDAGGAGAGAGASGGAGDSNVGGGAVFGGRQQRSATSNPLGAAAFSGTGQKLGGGGSGRGNPYRQGLQPMGIQ
jgi:deubiquitinase DESI2